VFFSGEEPESLRGPKRELCVIDEIARMRYQQQMFDMMVLGLRLGDMPRILIAHHPIHEKAGSSSAITWYRIFVVASCRKRPCENGDCGTHAASGSRFVMQRSGVGSEDFVPVHPAPWLAFASSSCRSVCRARPR
jgi:hypothetical protein